MGMASIAKMNTATVRWSRRYQTSLRKYLAQGIRASVQSAAKLGCQAVALGLETLDLARIHRQALMAVVSPGGSSRYRQRILERAKMFFSGVIVPIERTHSAALTADASVSNLTRALRRCTAEASTSTGLLKRNILLRKGAEQSLKRSGKRHIRLLAELHRRQKRLRNLTRTYLAAQEDERKRMSLQLHDEIAQALIAVDLRLLTLKNASMASEDSLKKEIAITQRFMTRSGKKFDQLALEFDVQHET